MTSTTEIAADNELAYPSDGLLRRSTVLLYGVLSYSLGMAGLMWFILAMGGLAPSALLQLENASVATSLAVNTGLILLFGLQHSIMARNSFKQWLYKHIPQAAERSTYVLLSGLLLMLSIVCWQSLPGDVWVVENTAGKIALWSLYGLGWAYLVLATFVTNHFELMGLRQMYLYFRGRNYSRLPFVNKYMYRYSRHPMMLGLLVGMWSVPVMSISQFIMAMLMSAYVAIGVLFEERDLVRQFGETYRNYRNEIATLIPRLF
ncbi:MAG: NnrU family protein [Chromatiales bacterium]|jgi:protein-S-isoprenylcysteine O-methyltransferase Ste14